MKVLKNHAIGIDLGSSRFVIAVVKQGGVEIITNEANYRSTPCLVSFGKERKMGDEAKAKIKQNIKNSIFYPFRYLTSMSPEQLGLERKFNFSKIRLENGRPVFTVRDEGENIDLSAQQVSASLLTKIQQICELNEIASNDIVVSVPSYFTSEERQALIDAATISGVKLLRVYNESTANVMNYGIFRKSDLSLTEERLVSFIDFGHSKTSLFVAKIWKNKAEIIFEKNDRNLGVRNFDYNILQHYVNVFDQKHKIDLYENPKSIYRLLESIEKQRIVFSGNKLSPINIECIFEDFDLSDNMKIEDYMKLNQGVLEQFKLFVDTAAAEIQSLGIDLKKIHSLERIGGGMRIPIIQEMVATAFGIEKVSKTLDANESISRGCAIQSAMISPRYHVQEFVIKELSHYPINIKIGYQEDNDMKEKLFFKQGSNFNKVLSVAIKKISPLNLQIIEKSDQRDIQILQAQVEAMKTKSDNFEGKVFVHLDKNGLVEVQKVELYEKSIVEEKIPKKKKEDKKDKKTDDDKKGMEIEEDEEFEIKKKERVVTTNVNFSQTLLLSLPKSTIEEYTKKEQHFLHKENLNKETQKIKYDLESFIYRSRELIQKPENQVFMTPQEKANLSQVLNDNESWLYGEGFNCSKDVLQDKFNQLQKSCNCFYLRKNKIIFMTDLIREASPAVNGFQSKNQTFLQEAKDVEASDIQQKLQECQTILKDMESLASNFSIQSIEAYDYEAQKNKINQNFQSMNNIVNEIKKRIKQREKEEREKKEKEEKERKEKEEKEKKEKEEKEKKEKAEQNNTENTQKETQKNDQTEQQEGMEVE